MDILLNIFWDIMDKADSIIGVFTAFFAGYAAYRLRLAARKAAEFTRETVDENDLKSVIERYKGIQTTLPVALAIDLRKDGDSIKNDVQDFLNKQNWSMPIEEIKRRGLNNPKDITDFYGELRKKRELIDRKKHTEVHVFIAGPVIAGAILGAAYRQWKPVKLYHRPYPQIPQIYEYWMPLI